ncbi:MAG: rRNA pseudouridine synthase [Novosphingobium sp.]|nr:rRNA pseudouridine synthase [Novosphingobium sp.]
MTDTPPDGAAAPLDTASPPPREGERIAKLLARAGIASRREVERMIAEGRVKIGDQVLTTPATVLTSLKGVFVDGKPVKAAEAARLFLFHKPSGLLTAERDPEGRPTIYTALRNALPVGTPRMMPVGRLDFNTEGLLVLTNDGELKRAMELPSSKIPRTYRARTFGAVTQDQLEALIEGIEIEGMQYGSINANMERSTGRNQWIEMTITEGKNREVRRVLDHLGLEVSRLIRTSYGPFELLDLPRGMVVEVKQVDVEKFAKQLSVGPAAQAGPSADAARNRVLRRGRPAGETGTMRPDPSAAPSRSGPKKLTGGKPRAAKPSGDKPIWVKPGAGRPTGGKPSGGKPTGDKPKPGGFRAR